VTLPIDLPQPGDQSQPAGQPSGQPLIRFRPLMAAVASDQPSALELLISIVTPSCRLNCRPGPGHR
jgi:hypothetical protein